MTALDLIQSENMELQARFADKLKVNPRLNRQLVSFQANKNKPLYRWFKYKEGFSEPLVEYLLDAVDIHQGQLLDPFAGTGTTLFVANQRGINGVGVELLPVGVELIRVRRATEGREIEFLDVLTRWLDQKPWRTHEGSWSFPHLRITEGAFPQETQLALQRYMSAIKTEEPYHADLLRVAVMCVLEEISYTRKDGQYLRWDYRSDRRQGNKPFDKGKIYGFDEAILSKLTEMKQDLQPNKGMLELFPPATSTNELKIIQGSCLNILPTLESTSFDGILTSPPYANRYDYTRTYALELALLGVNELELRTLRQAMVSCTVENKEKTGLESAFSPNCYQAAVWAFEKQHELNNILDYLEHQKALKALNNPGIPRMIKNYFFEMALIIFECARLLKPHAPFVMVNDNVRYGGAMIPVDLILSDFAEKAGFEVETIWVLPTGKGNSSQQMGVHGREEVRKCVYVWRRRG